MKNFSVLLIDEDIPMGEVFSGTREECERFVELEWELRTISGNPVEIDFEIVEASDE